MLCGLTEVLDRTQAQAVQRALLEQMALATGDFVARLANSSGPRFKSLAITLRRALDKRDMRALCDHIDGLVYLARSGLAAHYVSIGRDARELLPYLREVDDRLFPWGIAKSRIMKPAGYQKR